jgi:hypothetical protein
MYSILFIEITQSVQFVVTSVSLEAWWLVLLKIGLW